MPKALFGEISGAHTDCITVWKVQKMVEVADSEEARKIMLKEGYGGCVIASLLEAGVKLRIVGVNLTVNENPIPPPRVPRKEKH
jgi:hypothetical protein